MAVLRRQALAVIDERTTVICLTVNGQVVDVHEPFHTMNGDMWQPPFHVHCRTMVVPYVPGVPTVTKEAVEQLKKRPPSAFKHMPPKVRVSRWQRFKNALRRMMGDQGSIDVGDGKVLCKYDEIMANPTRWDVQQNGGGISDSFWVTDRQTGKRYVLKRGGFHQESMNEVLSYELDRAVGLKTSKRELVGRGDDAGNDWVLVEHVEDTTGWKIEGTGPGHSSVVKLEGVERHDLVKWMFRDFVRDEADRKGGNWLLMRTKGGARRIVPIDDSLGMMGWRGAFIDAKFGGGWVKGDWSLAGRLKVTKWRQYLKTRGAPKGWDELAVRLGHEKPERMVKAIDDELQRWRDVDLDVWGQKMLAKYGDKSDVREHVAEVVELVKGRRKALLDARDEFVERFAGVKPVKAVVEPAKPKPRVSSWRDESPLQQGGAELEQWMTKVADEYAEVVGSAVGGLDVKVTGVALLKGRGEVQIELALLDGGVQAGRIARRVRPSDGEVDHVLFELEPQYRGKGIGARVTEVSFDAYRSAGMEKVTTQANIDVGGYAWARLGFTWDRKLTDEGDVARLIRDVVRSADDVPGMNPAWYEEVEAAGNRMLMELDDGWPEPVEVAMLGWRPGVEMWPGKAGLMKSSWRAARDV